MPEEISYIRWNGYICILGDFLWYRGPDTVRCYLFFRVFDAREGGSDCPTAGA